jgi:hypothetical protein
LKIARRGEDSEGDMSKMLDRISQTAQDLDEWLHQHWGRSYVAILGWGLVLSILGSLSVLRHAVLAGGSGLPPIVVLVFQAALLVNQLAQWHQLKARRLARKAGAPARGVDGPVVDIADG